MDGAEQRGAGGGQGEEVVIAGGSRRRLPRRLGDLGGKRRAGDGAGELAQAGRLGRLQAEHPGDEDLVEGINGGQGLVDPADGPGEQVGAHQASVRVGGNHCISGNGAVTGARSR